MPTIDVQSFSEQQKQKDLMKESNKALEATKEVKPEQEEPKQVQEPVVKEVVVKEEPVKELPSMDNKEEDHPTDFEYEEIKNLYAELFDIAQHYDEFTNSDYQAALEALEFYGMNYEEMDKQVMNIISSIEKGIPYEVKTNFKTIVLF